MKAIEISKEPVDSVQSNGKISKKESGDSIARRTLVRKLLEIGMKGFHETTVVSQQLTFK